MALGPWNERWYPISSSFPIYTFYPTDTKRCNHNLFWPTTVIRKFPFFPRLTSVGILKRLGNIYINVKFNYFQLLPIFVVNFSLLRRSEKALQLLFDGILRPVVAWCLISGRTNAITQVSWLTLFWTPCHTAYIGAKAKFLFSYKEAYKAIISDGKNRRQMVVTGSRVSQTYEDKTTWITWCVA